MKPNPTTREMLRLMQAADGDPEANLERSIALDDGNDTDATGAIDLPPFRLRPYLSLAHAKLKGGDAAAGATLLERVAGRWPNDPDLHLVLALCRQALEDWPGAEVAFRRCLELEPRAYVSLLFAGMLDRLERHDEARWWLHHTLVIDPNYEEAHYNIGWGHAKRGRLDEAVQSLRRAIELDPLYTVAHAALGKALLRRSRQTADLDWTAARNHLGLAVELASDDPEVHRLVAEMEEAG